jgi:inosine-uridine nucleoside N-ribohydrolase
MINVILNMETADPDDVLTLCMLSHHPKVNLCAVVVVPGSYQQVALVKDVLCMLDKSNHIPVGVRSPDHPKSCVSEFHNKWLGERRYLTEWKHDGLGEDIIRDAVSKFKDLKIISGAALSCISKYVELYPASKTGYNLKEIYIQGGFAGDPVVPTEHRLEKFKGKTTCPTFNLNADVKAALNIVATQEIKRKFFISKNVCHGIVYDQEMHERIKPFRNDNPGINLMVDGMECYLKRKPSGKKFHDPLAACVAIDNDICKFAPVEIYREKSGEWGSKLKEDSNTMISIAIDREKFETILVGK